MVKLNGGASSVIKTINVGTEPYSLVLTPNGTKLYCANSRSATVSVIDTSLNKVVETIDDVGFEPRGLGRNDGDADDTDETLYVTQFLSTPATGKIDGSDDAKRGRVTAVSTSNDQVTALVALNPLKDTGFKAQGDALQRIPPGVDFVFKTGAYPNQLNNIAIKGKFAFVPSTGASPNGPVRFDAQHQSLLSIYQSADKRGMRVKRSICIRRWLSKAIRETLYYAAMDDGVQEQVQPSLRCECSQQHRCETNSQPDDRPRNREEGPN